MINSNFDKNCIIDQIRRAFINVKNPGEKMVLSNSPSSKLEIQSFLSKKWKTWGEIDVRIIDYHYDVLPFFSFEGFHFILPAYMIYALENPSSNVAISTIYALTAPNELKKPSWFERFIQRASQFTNEQIEAIVIFLKYQEYINSMEVINEATEALESYWNHRSLTRLGD